jgi:hypothetical protein
MARKAQQQASQAVDTENKTSGGFGAAASSIGGPLTAQLQSEATNPTGFSPEDINSMLVGGEEAAGGATGDLASDASLAAARTRNTGSTSGVLDALQRQKTQTLGANALGVQNQNAMLKQTKQQDAQRALQGLFGTDVNAQLSAMGLVPGTVNAETNAGSQGWLQNVEGIGNMITGGGQAAGSILKGLQ